MTGSSAADPGARDLIGDVQRFGLLSATSVVDRYVGLVDRAVGGARPGAGQTPSSDASDAQLVESATRAVDAYVRVLEQVSALVGEGSSADREPGGPERVALPPTSPGTPSETQLWIHNPTSTPTATTEVTHTALSCATGSVVPVEGISISPSTMGPLAAGTSRRLRLRVDVPRDQAYGRYHGLVLISTAPAEPLAISLDIGRGGR